MTMNKEIHLVVTCAGDVRLDSLYNDRDERDVIPCVCRVWRDHSRTARFSWSPQGEEVDDVVEGGVNSDDGDGGDQDVHNKIIAMSKLAKCKALMKKEKGEEGGVSRSKRMP
eukprot:755733-Hanusia_phi.AAC.3